MAEETIVLDQPTGTEGTTRVNVRVLDIIAALATQEVEGVASLRGSFSDRAQEAFGRRVRGGRICGSCSCRRFQPFRFGGEAVPFSVGIWESEAVFGYMDGDWVRSGDRVLRGLPGEGSAACEDHGGDDGKDRGYGFS